MAQVGIGELYLGLGVKMTTQNRIIKTPKTVLYTSPTANPAAVAAVLSAWVGALEKLIIRVDLIRIASTPPSTNAKVSAPGL
jgi:hypothetical protein